MAGFETLCHERYPETELLRQIQGVGPITGLAYVLTLEDPHRFAKSRTVGSYLGLRPKKRQSGERDPRLGITKEGDRYQVLCLWHRSLKRRSHKARVLWPQMARLAKGWLPYPAIVHPYPAVRFARLTRGRSPVR